MYLCGFNILSYSHTWIVQYMYVFNMDKRLKPHKNKNHTKNVLIYDGKILSLHHSIKFMVTLSFQCGSL